MNDKFFQLSEEKQQAIINAGFRVFSQNTYKKSPMSEIAASADISKSLLFYYFHNKKELYLYLWKKASDLTLSYLKESGCYEETDFFEIMLRGLTGKVKLIKQYPDLGSFVMKSFYEKDPEVVEDIRKIASETASYKTNKELLKFSPNDFIEGIDLNMMYKEMYYASEGYLWENMQKGTIDVDKMEEDFKSIIAFWKKIYLRKEE